jgi:transcriptional regulator
MRSLSSTVKERFFLPLIIDKNQATLLLSIIKGRLMKPTDLVQGTLDLLILRTVALEPMHGWAIAQRIQQISKGVLQVQQGSLYPALYRLEEQGFIKSEWGESENKRKAKFYTLTRAGKQTLEKQIEQWDRLSAAVSLVIREA